MAESVARPPNVVCIMPDGTDFVWLSCYGGRTPTPNIDRIAEAGVRRSTWTLSITRLI